MNYKILVSFFLLNASLNVYAEDTVPGQQATKNGFITCKKTVDDIARFVAKDHEHSSLSTWNNKTPDTRMFNSNMNVKYSDGNSVAVISVSPTKSGKCDGAYTTIFPIAESCAVARETTFKDWKFFSESAGLIVLENINGNLSKTLLPVGSGCAAITTEVVYN